MKSKSVCILAAFVAIILFAGTSAFGQAAAGTATFFAIDDTTELAGRTMDFSVNLNFVDADSLFGADSGWVFFTATDSAFEEMNSDHGLMQDSLLVYGTGGIVQVGQGGVTEQYDSEVHIYNEYNEGDTVFIYVTLPFISDSVIAVSEGFVVLHQPVVEAGVTPSAFDTTLNSGPPEEIESLNLEFAVVDVDDIEEDVSVWIFLDENSTLTKDNFTAGTPVTFGENSILISPEQGGTGALNRSDTLFTFEIVEYSTIDSILQSYTPKGDYNVYVVAYDGKNANIGKSDFRLTVKHAPSIGLDRPIAGADSINTADQQMITINWSSTGDKDIDDEALIAIYMEDADSSYTVASELMASVTRKDVTGGFTINEQDNELSDDQYVWDLMEVSSANMPVADTTYVFYALIMDDKDTTLAESPGTVKFTHYPKVEFLFNPGIGVGKGAGVSQITIDNGQVFRVNFNAFDLDDDEYIQMFISKLDPAVNDYDEYLADEGVTTWLMNSTTGLVADVYNLTTDDSYLNWYSGKMASMDALADNGSYYIIAYITEDGNNVFSTALTVEYAAPGKLMITGRERAAADLPNWDLSIVPDVVTTNKGDTVRLDVWLDTKNVNVQQVAFYLDIDTSLFEIVDPEEPFKYSVTDFFGGVAPLENTSIVNGDKIELNFMKYYQPGGTAPDTLLTYFEVIAKDNDSTGTLTSEVLFANTGDRFPRLTSQGASRTIPVPTPAITVLHNPLGRIMGRIPLQGRDNFSKVITLELREIGSLNPIDNSYFNSVNDDPAYAGVNGLQVVTDRDGFYELMKIPTGTYYLVAKTGGYLSGQYESVTVLPEDILVDIDPTYDNVGPDDLGELKGGDVSSGNLVAYQDGIVDGDDINFLITNYNLVVTGDHPYAIGDIDGNGIISEEDLFIASANFDREGIPPYGNKVSGGQNNLAKVALDGIPEVTFENQEFTVSVFAEDVDDLLGFVFTIDYDPDEITLVENDAIREGDFLRTRSGSAGTIFFNRHSDSGMLVFGSLLGSNGEHLSGSGDIAILTFRSLVDDIHPNVTLTKVKIANSEAEIKGLGDVVQLPGAYSLSQNYPNPFNMETAIRFELPKAAHVTLKIYNMLGQEVATLVNGDIEAGYKVVKWEGKNQFGHPVASGMYIYRLATPEFSKAIKMLLIK